MKKVINFLENTKIPIDIWFFFLFLFSFSLSIRKIILYFPIQGTFNEYSGIYVYMSDILLVLTIILWLFTILYNNKYHPSTVSLWITYEKHKLSTMSRLFLNDYFISLPFLLVIWSFLSILWASNQNVALFRSLKLLEFYLLYLYIILRLIPQMFHVKQIISSPCQKEDQGGVARVQRGTSFTEWNIPIVIIIVIGTIQSLIGIIQVFIQQSLGLSLLRESLISPSLPGVAKIMFHGEHYIRAYGLFPHPNILGGFLLFSIFLTNLFIRVLHTKQSMSSPYQGEGGRRPDEVRDVPHGTIFTNLLYFSLAVQFLALILSFSKSAILGLAIALLYIYVPHLPSGKKVEYLRNCFTPAPLVSNVPRGIFENFTGWNNSRIRIIILVILVIITLLFISKQDLGENLNQSIEERLTYLNVSRGTILASPILGVGIGQFVWNMERYSPIPLEAWQLQPVHNVFLLIWSELGIIGVGIFIYWLYRVFTTKSILCNDNNYLSNVIPLRYFKGILLGFIIIMLFDHYFWDIQQGSLMLWMTMGFIAGLSNQK